VRSSREQVSSGSETAVSKAGARGETRCSRKRLHEEEEEEEEKAR